VSVDETGTSEAFPNCRQGSRVSKQRFSTHNQIHLWSTAIDCWFVSSFTKTLALALSC